MLRRQLDSALGCFYSSSCVSESQVSLGEIDQGKRQRFALSSFFQQSKRLTMKI